jgi:hypothetical protein
VQRADSKRSVLVGVAVFFTFVLMEMKMLMRPVPVVMGVPMYPKLDRLMNAPGAQTQEKDPDEPFAPG